MSTQTMTPQQMAEACAKVMWDGDNASNGLGMKLVSVAPGQSIVSMQITAAMVNGHGTCHGGYIFTLADSAFAFACNSYNQRTVAQHCSITFLAPGKLGDMLTAHASELSRTGRSGIYDIMIDNQDGVTIAIFRGHCRTIKGEILPGATMSAASVAG
ncbi:MAG: hydroxyphenylacetyl-CoA thioesterase PaaI [Bosea sp. (in: a-proteobacteria)]